MTFIQQSWGGWASIRQRFEWPKPTRYNIAEAVCGKHVAKRQQVAMWYETAAGESRQYTFGQMHDLSNRLANALRGLGLEQGDRVGIILPQRPETAITHLAAYKSGAIALPMSVLFGPDALEYRLNDSQAKFLVTDPSRWPIIESIRANLPHLEQVIVCGGSHDGLDFWETLEQGGADFTPVDTEAELPALLIYTSGTTGPPKGALHAHRAFIGHLTGFEMSHNFFPQPDDAMWTPADWAWIGGLLDGLFPAWYYGVPVLGYDGGKFDPEKAVHLMAKYNIRNSFLPPTAIKMMMQLPENKVRAQANLRSVMSAGEAVGERVLAWGREALDLTINEMWGQTEVNYLVGNCSAVMSVKPGSMGKPYPGHVVEVIDEQGNPMPDNEIGELACLTTDDPVIFLRYWNRPEAKPEKMIGDWFTTGDVGYRDEEGYLWFVGRKDDVISSAGYRIGPTEIEDCLLGHAAVAEAAVIGVPDELRGNAIKAFIIPAAGHEPSQALVEALQQHVRQRLAAYEYPREIEFIDAFPRTTTGKVRRMALRQRELEKGKAG